MPKGEFQCQWKSGALDWPVRPGDLVRAYEPPTSERLAQIALPAGSTPSSAPPAEASQLHVDEHADNLEVSGASGEQ
jgi:hypothetical protein